MDKLSDLKGKKFGPKKKPQQVKQMIAEILTWLAQQNLWVEPIFKVVVVFACIKYILFGQEEK